MLRLTLIKMTNQDIQPQHFYLTEPQSCPYLPEQFERKIFTQISDASDPENLDTFLTQNGFRRSQRIFYRPQCDNCTACVSVRILVDDFLPNSSFKRIIKKNSDISSNSQPSVATSEQYNLFHSYLNARHQISEMKDMTETDYKLMVEENYTKTQLIEYRKTDIANNAQNPLIAVALTDILQDGLSMVYSFYSHVETQRSLGTYMILDHIKKAQQMGLPYVYLGFWVKGCQNMNYKKRFQPQEHFIHNGWQLYS